MAPRSIQIVLAVEVAAPWRPTSRVVGNSPAGPPDEHRQSIVGNAVHGELLMLGIEIGQTSVAKYMARRRARRRRAGGHSFATMLTALRRWTFSWCRQSPFVRSMAC